MNKNIIECHQLRKDVKQKNIINDISFSLQEGEILCLVGPSGCGKTTTLRCVAGLDDLTSGSVWIDGVDVTESSAQERPVVMMFQQPLLFPHLTVLQNTMYGLKMKKTPKAERKKAAMEMLINMEIEPLADAYPFELSGGQQQRVALARALIVKPRVLLLDEPFSSLDPELRISIRTWVKKKLKEWHTTAIFVTHDKEEASVLADRIAVMKEGKIKQLASLQELYEKPRTHYVAKYMSEGLSIRNQFILLSKITILQTFEDTFDHCCPAHVLAVFYKGGQRFIQVELIEKEISVTIICPFEANKDDRVYLCFNEIDVQFFD